MTFNIDSINANLDIINNYMGEIENSSNHNIKLSEVDSAIKNLIVINNKLFDPTLKQKIVRSVNSPTLEHTQGKAKDLLVKACEILNVLKKEETPLQKLQLTDHGFCTEIPVMPQRSQSEIGWEACCYQSFKNALVGMSVALNPNTKVNSFESKKIYDYFYNFMKKYRVSEEHGHRDIPISILPQILRDFAQLKNQDLPEEIRPIHLTLLEFPSSISMFNIPKDETGKNMLLLTDETVLLSLSNLVDVSKKPGPFTHSFVLGNEIPPDRGHWTTLILQKDKNGDLNWFGCDSDHSSRTKELFKENINLLKSSFSNLDKLLKSGYEGSVGEEWRRFASAFNSDGTLKPDEKSHERVTLLVPGVSGEDKIAKLIKSFEFVNKAGWLEKTDDPEIKSYLKDMKTLVNHLCEFDPDKLNPIAQKLNSIPLA